MSWAVHAFADEAAAAKRLAEALEVPLQIVDLHRFPDGEGMPTVPHGADRVVAYRSLDRPDPKIMPLLLACDAWRRAGVRELVLAAPYMAYLRQDQRFAPGQPVSDAVIGALIGERFDHLVTVDPHRHRVKNLASLFRAPTYVLTAAPILAEAFRADAANALVVGPDEESEPWAATFAAVLDAEHTTLRKVRRGDRAVELAAPEARVAGRPVILVDDICSSGATLIAAAAQLRRLGPSSLQAAVVHALHGSAVDAALKAAGVSRLISTDGCPHPSNSVSLAGLIANTLKDILAA